LSLIAEGLPGRLFLFFVCRSGCYLPGSISRHRVGRDARGRQCLRPGQPFHQWQSRGLAGLSPQDCRLPDRPVGTAPPVP